LKSRWGQALVAVFILRLCLVAIAQAFPEGGVLVDSRGYLDMASEIRLAGWAALGQGDLHWTPGYPAFLLLAETLTGTSLVGVGLLQLVLTGAAAFLLWWVGARLGYRCVGIAAAWLYLLSPSAGLWSLTIMSESLFAFLLVLALAFLVLGIVDGRIAGWALAGGTLAAAALVRPIGLPLIAIWALAALTAPTAGAPSRRRASVGAATGVAVLLAASIAAVAPWVVRNWSVTGQPVFAEVPADTLVSFNLAYVVAEAEGITRDEAAARLSAEVDSWEDGLEIVRRYPLIFVGQQMEGFRRSLIGVESGVWARQFGFGLERQGSLEVLSVLFGGDPWRALERLRILMQDGQTALLTVLSVVAVVYTGALYLLGVLGLGSVLRPGGPARAVFLVAGLTTVYLLLAPGAAGQARFRIPIEPYLALFAGAGCSVLIRRARTRNWFRRIAPEADADLADRRPTASPTVPPGSERSSARIGAPRDRRPRAAHV
jgi:4-amino-4-deoxy-L-arabinose transferase-like glycosyltransferase